MIRLKVKKAETSWQRTRGLIGSKKPYALFFKTGWGIHTFGMKDSIDIVVLDANYTVVVIKFNLLPNRFFFWNPKYNIVIELPAGTIVKKNIKTGSKIKIAT